MALDFTKPINSAENISYRVQDQTICNQLVVPPVQYGPITLDAFECNTHEFFSDEIHSTSSSTSQPIHTNHPRYVVTQHQHRSQRGSLIDRGANGGIVGSDAHVRREHPFREVDVTGIDNHEMNSLKIVDAAAKVMTQVGPVIIIMHQYAYHGQGRTIHSAIQIEHFKNKVDDRSMRVGGQQCIRTHDGYVIPLDIINGLPYMKMKPYTDAEWDSLPKTVITSPTEWKPTLLDNTLSSQPDWYNHVKQIDDGLIDTPFDQFGNYRHRVSDSEAKKQDIDEGPPPPDCISTNNHITQDDSRQDIEDVYDNVRDPTLELREVFHAACNLNQLYVVEEHETDENPFNPTEPEDGDNDTEIEVNPPKEQQVAKINYEKYRPYFLHVPVEKVKQTFLHSTQFATNVMSGRIIQQTIKSPYPAFNVKRRNEPVATDTIYGGTPAIDCGYTCAQIYVGRKSLVIDVFGMHSTKQFVNTLEDIIRKRGAMDLLISDGAKVELTKRVLEILRYLHIKNWQSERNCQRQNYCENRWKHLQRNVEWIMNLRNVDPEAWLLCLEWVADVMNHTSEKSLGYKIPLSKLTGETTDISIILIFLFWDVVYVPRYASKKYHEQIGSKQSSEIRGRFVGFAWDVGHALTFKILTDDTKKIICRSRVRLAPEGENNLRLDVEEATRQGRVYIWSEHDETQPLPTIDISGDRILAITAPTPPTDSNDSQVQNESDATTPPAETVDTPVSVNPRKKGEKSPNATQAKPLRKPYPKRISDSVRDDPTLRRITRSGKHTRQVEVHDMPTVETVDEEVNTKPFFNDDIEPIVMFPEDGYTPMDDPPLSELPEVEGNIGDIDPEDIAPHLHTHKAYIKGVLQEDPPLNVLPGDMDTPNPVEHARLPPEELLNRTVLLPPRDDGTRERARITEILNLHKDGVRQDDAFIKFQCDIGTGTDKYHEILAYNDIVDFIETDESYQGVYKYNSILGHRNNPKTKHLELFIEWDDFSRSWEPFSTPDKKGFFDVDPVTVAAYAREHNLVGTPGWSRPALRAYIKNDKVLRRRVNQAKLHSFRHKPVYMFGVLVPRNYDQAIQLDRENGNNLWQESVDKELAQIDEYDTFQDKGKGFNPGSGWKKIRVHLVFACKHDGRRKARLVAGGHLTDTPIDSVYSSVVSLRGIRILAFLGELNGLDIYGTDIGNAYLESYTQEKVYIVAGPEFGDRYGHTLIIVKALYGLKSSGLRWHERLSDVLRAMGYIPSKAEPDIWMRDCGDHWEYIAVYVDDLFIVSKNPAAIIETLMQEYNFKLKGSGPISYHLGCDFMRDEDGNLCYQPRKYIEKLLANYERLFGCKPKQCSSPLVEGDHPELDTSELLDLDGIKQYQSLIGGLQWVIQIGRFDIQTSVMTLSRFRAAPRQGHLERVKHIFGYLSKMRHGIVRIRTDEPDYSDIPDQHYDWTHTCYGSPTEEIPTDIPRALGRRVITSSFVDANLYHDLISGRSVTGILHLLNKTPFDWYSKLQNTVETATFGSEYVAARIATEQIIDIRITLRYLGVPIHGPSYLFGDNESVVNSSSQPHGKLHKRHTALSYHRVRHGIASKILKFFHVKGTQNPADVLSKHWSYAKVWNVLRPLLFWRGDTADLAKPSPAEPTLPTPAAIPQDNCHAN